MKETDAIETRPSNPTPAEEPEAVFGFPCVGAWRRLSALDCGDDSLGRLQSPMMMLVCIRAPRAKTPP